MGIQTASRGERAPRRTRLISLVHSKLVLLLKSICSKAFALPPLPLFFGAAPEEATGHESIAQ